MGSERRAVGLTPDARAGARAREIIEEFPPTACLGLHGLVGERLAGTDQPAHVPEQLKTLSLVRPPRNLRVVERFVKNQRLLS